MTTGSTCLRVEIFASLAAVVRKNFLKCFLTACVLSARSRLISFLTLCPWPAARSGFWFTMNTADGRVRQREGQGGWERQPLTHYIVPTAKKQQQKNWNVASKCNPGLCAEACRGSSRFRPCYAEAVSDLWGLKMGADPYPLFSPSVHIIRFKPCVNWSVPG